MIIALIAFVFGVLAGGFGGYKIGGKAKAAIEAELAKVQGEYNRLANKVK